MQCSFKNRLIVIFEGVQKQVVIKPDEIKGPNVKSPEVALEGFLRSNKVSKKELYEKETEKDDELCSNAKTMKR